MKDNKANLCYALDKKREKIIEYKELLSNLMKWLCIGYTGLIAILIFIVINSEYYVISFSAGEKLFPNLRKIDSLLFVISTGVGLCLYLLSKEHSRIKNKYDLLRHDIMKDLDSTIIATKICLCRNDCDCRENFFKEMDNRDIDIIFKKFKPDQKYSL